MARNEPIQLGCMFATGVTDGSDNTNCRNCSISRNGVGDYTVAIGPGIFGMQTVSVQLTILFGFAGPAVYQINPIAGDMLQLLFFQATALPALVPMDVVFTLAGLNYP